MNRKPFSQILRDAEIDIPKEYDRLIKLFCEKKYFNAAKRTVSLVDLCAENFINMPFRGTCISLSDFDRTYNRRFTSNSNSLYQQNPDAALDYLIDFCEYSYNLAINTQTYCFPVCIQDGLPQTNNAMVLYVQQVLSLIEKIGFMPNTGNNITDFVPKDQVAIAVAEIIDPFLSYRVLEYNHHSMKGDLQSKKDILLALANQLEPQERKLKEINSSFGNCIFGLFNNLNIRHNNIDPDNERNYKPAIAEMESAELENWYDDTYQLCLLAFLELENVERKKRASEFVKRMRCN